MSITSTVGWVVMCPKKTKKQCSNCEKGGNFRPRPNTQGRWREAQILWIQINTGSATSSTPGLLLKNDIINYPSNIEHPHLGCV